MEVEKSISSINFQKLSASTDYFAEASIDLMDYEM